ncbi:MAG: bifunctional glycosyltransferase family 2/GtrA family protein [Clostridia bacterium]|nr:bifunctional glycosyltransferase family 2/GtrA family protein [Clostridia bacterium]
MIVVIPAYEPDEKLLGVLKDFTEQTSYSIVVVNDGSSENCRRIFDAVREFDRVTLLEHECNKGKGAAMKTAFAYISKRFPSDESVMTVDADGQHLVSDAVRVAEKLKEHPDALVLGSRRFTGNVPFKSRAGNAITRTVFRFCTGVRVYDTQTGLRAFSASRIPEMLALKGDRYEYEINQLIHCTKNEIRIVEEWIDTVYIEENKSSHFHAVKDSFRIYKVLLLGTSFVRFIASSFFCFLIDYLLFLLFRSLFPNLFFGELIRSSVEASSDSISSIMTAIKPYLTTIIFLSTACARVVSSTCNYLLNRFLVFGARNTSMSFAKYVLLAVIMLCLQAGLTSGAAAIGLNDRVFYVIIQIILYPVTYLLQRAIVFKRRNQKDIQPGESI